MIDMAEIVKRFIGDALEDQQELLQYDRAVMDALSTPTDKSSADAVIRWLRLYKVLRIKKQTHRPIARAILNYADELDRNTLPLEGRGLLKAYEDLHEAVQRVGPKKRDGAKRGLISLTSKALWCLSPETVPIYDSRALNAVTTLSRLSGIQVPAESGYAGYIQMWQKLYGMARPTIKAADLNGYPYEVRIFDKILWLIG